ncbi:MAG: histidine phosphatase family protein [Clostridia bacterium]|nr:histidine phosphatase family protein [Clostridia bacterium]
MTKLIIVRHAEAAGNKERYFQGHTDGKVSEKGRLQLEKLSERFADIPFDAIYSSPLSRAVETAEAINRYMKLPITTDDRLMEINGGCWEGNKWADLPTLYPEQAYNWSAAPWDFDPDGGESMRECYARLSEAIKDIAAQNDGKTVAIASHGCAIRVLLCWAKGWVIERLNDVEWCDNTGINIVEIENGVPTLISENDSSHITEELSTFAAQKWWRADQRGEMCYDD